MRIIAEAFNVGRDADGRLTIKTAKKPRPLSVRLRSLPLIRSIPGVGVEIDDCDVALEPWDENIPPGTEPTPGAPDIPKEAVVCWSVFCKHCYLWQRPLPGTNQVSVWCACGSAKGPELPW
jgi:hypothetical protein